MFGNKIAALLLLPIMCFLCTPPTHGQERSAEMKALLKKRVEIANDVLKGLPDQYDVGLVDLTTLLQAERDVLQAYLDLHELPGERIPVLRKLARLSADVAKRVEDRRNVGVAKAFEVDMANVVVLDIQIRLLKEEEKLAAAKAQEKQKRK